MHKPKKTLLVSMPFAPIYPPSPQLSALDAYLTDKGHSVECRHLYLKCADYIGIKPYAMISNSVSLLREILYTRILFPEHFEKQRDRLDKYLKESMEIISKELDNPSAIEDISRGLDGFNASVLRDVGWGDYDLIGFSVNFSQLLPSLFVSKAIKTRYPEIEIVFGGCSVGGEVGRGIMNAFPCVDYIVSGEGEKSLVDLVRARTMEEIRNIDGILYRVGSEIAVNAKKGVLDLDTLPFFRLDSYFDDLKTCSAELRNHCEINFSIPFESSRGCWWNKCNFCNYTTRQGRFRSKSPERIKEEFEFQSNKYQSLSFLFLDETIAPSEIGKVFDSIAELGRDFMIASISRANRISKSDLQKMYRAGVTIHQIGAEAFSTSLLDKMNKGTTAMENVQILKQLIEVGISPKYTLMYNFPYQDETDYRETVRALGYLKGFPPPVALFSFELQFGSLIFNEYEKFNISSMHPIDVLGLCYPPDVVEKLRPTLYTYKLKEEKNARIDEFRAVLETFKSECKAIQDEMKNKPALFYNDGGEFLLIHDLRDKNKNKYVVEGVEREVFLFCDEKRTFEDIRSRFNGVSEETIRDILKMFDEHKLIFSDRDEYISLPVKYRRSSPA